jgi:hypothetical protein
MQEEDYEEEMDKQIHGDDAQTKPDAKKRGRPHGSTNKKPKKKAKDSTAPKQRLNFPPFWKISCFLNHSGTLIIIPQLGPTKRQESSGRQ